MGDQGVTLEFAVKWGTRNMRDAYQAGRYGTQVAKDARAAPSQAL